jgi:ligand-binding sensor domain-containing protein
MAFEPDGSWRAFPDLPSRGFEVNPNAMAASTRGVYAGSLGRGLAIFSLTTGRWNWLTDGLPSLNVTAVAVRNGVVYIGTDNGLVKAEESGLVRE